MTLKAKEPIVIYDHMWTKERIFDQLCDENYDEVTDFTAEDIPDAAAVKWAMQEYDIRSEAISNGEEYYDREVHALNVELIATTRKC